MRTSGKGRLLILFIHRMRGCALLRLVIRFVQEVVERIMLRLCPWRRRRSIGSFNLGNGILKQIALANRHSLRGISRNKFLLDRCPRFRVDALTQLRRLVRLRIDRLFQYRYKICHSVLPGFCQLRMQ